MLDRRGLRTRLVEALELRQLVLVSAPAGFGKTALLVQALSNLPADTVLAWMHCEPEDDIHRFLGGLIEALDPFDPPWTVAPDMLATVALEPNGLLRVAAELSHALASAEAPRGVLALDDMHSVSDQRVFELLEMVVGALPPGWTIVIASRVVPQMKLSRLWFQGLVAEFGQDDLRFTEDEVQQLLQTWESPRVGEAILTGVDGHDARAERLVRETGGWIAGICLSLMAGGGGSASLANRLGRRHMFEYLASEVLGGLQKELRDFLVRCSVLPELTASRCKALTGDPRAAQWLGQIDSAGLFVTASDGPELTLKLHDLFRSFLEDRLREDYPQELTSLLERAADGEPDLVRRIDMLQEAGAWARVEEVLSHAAETLTTAEAANLVRMSERFPEALRKASPALAYMRGLTVWPMMLFEPMEMHMAAAASGFDEQGQPLHALRARAYLALATFHAGRIDEALTLMQACRTQPHSADREVLAVCGLLELSVAVVRGPAEAPARHLQRLTDILLGAPADLWYRCMWVTAFVVRPRFQSALQRFLDEALVAAGDSHLRLRALVQFHQINATILCGDAVRARVLMRRLEEDMAWLAQAPRRLLFVRIHLALLEGGKPIGQIQELIAERQTVTPRPALARNACFYLARQSANLGDWDTVRRMVALAEVHGAFPEGPFMKFPPEILRARLLLHDGQALQARELLRPLLEGLSEIDHHGTEDFVRVTLATAELRCGDATAAWQVLLPTIDGITATGNLMRVIMSGADLLAELAAAAWGDVADAQRLALLNSCVARARAGVPAAATIEAASGPGVAEAASGMPVRVGALEGLTRRELEVLERLAAGDSNKVIGHTLEVSPNTIKRHVARILDRLGVDSRGEAASWYRRQRPGSVATQGISH